MNSQTKTLEQIVDNKYGEGVVEICKAIRQFYGEKIEELKKDRFLKKDNLQYQIGWVDGHKQGVNDAKGCL